MLKPLGATMIHVTDDQVEAMTLASRIAVMKEGQIQQIDTPQNERPAVLGLRPEHIARSAHGATQSTASGTPLAGASNRVVWLDTLSQRPL